MPSTPETQAAERTALAQQRSRLAFLLIGALLTTHAHARLGVAAGLLVMAAGLSAHRPRELAACTALAAVCAATIVLA